MLNLMVVSEPNIADPKASPGKSAHLFCLLACRSCFCFSRSATSSVLRLPQRNLAHSSSVSSSFASRGSSGVSAERRLSTVGLRLGVVNSREGLMRKEEVVVEVEVGVAGIVSGLVGVRGVLGKNSAAFVLSGLLSFGGLPDVGCVGRLRVGGGRGLGLGFSPLSVSSCSSVSCLGVILLLLNTGGSMIMGFLKQQK